MFNPDTARGLGLIVGETLESEFVERWDPMPVDEPTDCGWIGEDARGVWIKRHPQIALAEHPRLWQQAGRFAAGMQEVTERDWDELSAFEFAAKLTMVSSHNRMLWRRAKPEDDGDDDTNRS